MADQLPIDIVYQYIHGPAAWEELKYSIRSVYKHFKDPFRIWICGTRPPYLKDDSYHYMHMPRQRADFRPNCLDQVNKLEAICNHPEISSPFILMYDDIMLLKPTRTSDLEQFYAVDPVPIRWQPSGTHKNLIANTAQALRSSRVPDNFNDHRGGIVDVWNCETHLPRLYKKVQLGIILRVYGARENRLLPSTLYFNVLFKGKAPTLLHRDDAVKLELHGRNDKYGYSNKPADIEPVWSRKQFLNFRDSGMTPWLKQKLMEEFPEASPLEG